MKDINSESVAWTRIKFKLLQLKRMEKVQLYTLHQSSKYFVRQPYNNVFFLMKPYNKVITALHHFFALDKIVTFEVKEDHLYTRSHL